MCDNIETMREWDEDARAACLRIAFEPFYFCGTVWILFDEQIL